jgi:hypothetical protein
MSWPKRTIAASSGRQVGCNSPHDQVQSASRNRLRSDKTAQHADLPLFCRLSSSIPGFLS